MATAVFTGTGTRFYPWIISSHTLLPSCHPVMDAHECFVTFNISHFHTGRDSTAVTLILSHSLTGCLTIV
jgi:hypothetical protein